MHARHVTNCTLVLSLLSSLRYCAKDYINSLCIYNLWLCTDPCPQKMESMFVNWSPLTHNSKKTKTKNQQQHIHRKRTNEKTTTNKQTNKNRRKGMLLQTSPPSVIFLACKEKATTTTIIRRLLLLEKPICKRVAPFQSVAFWSI